MGADDPVQGAEGGTVSDKRAEILAWLDGQERLCAAATAGPWKHGMVDESVHEITGKDDDYDFVLWAQVCSACQKRHARCTSGKDADYDFICAARTILPLALATLRGEAEYHVPTGPCFCRCGGLRDCAVIERIHAATVGAA